MDHGRFYVSLLGPFGAWLGCRAVTPSAGKQRQILALLARNAGQVVGVPVLTEELWGGSPPRWAATTLQTYVVQLRNRFAAGPGGPGRRDLIGTRHGGYLLDANDCVTDVAEFERLARAGRAAAEAGDHEAAADLLAQALATWHGTALADVPSGPVLALEAASLEGSRLGVLERRIEADLALGRHADIIGELMLLTARNPMNENFCALLMTAFYRSGYVAEALTAFRRLRTVLSAELGVEPCPRLRRLQQAVLAGDPSLEMTWKSGTVNRS